MRNIKEIFQKLKTVNKKNLFGGLTLFFVLGVMLWAFVSAGLITANFNRSQIEGAQDEQKVNAVGIIITETKDGNKYFEIYGETGNYTNEHNVATLYNVVGNFYKEGEVAMSFQSSQGTYNEKEGTITLYDNIYIVLKDFTSLESDKLTWYGSDKDTIAEGNVRIKKGREMVSLADKCIIGSNYESFKIIGKTKTSLYEKDTPKS